MCFIVFHKIIKDKRKESEILRLFDVEILMAKLKHVTSYMYV